MNVSSISGGSAAWEEYLEKIRRQQQSQSAGESSAKKSEKVDIKQLLAELQSMEDDPETLKARASELAAQVAEAAESADGKHASMLNALAADLETVANTGDLSVITEKMTQSPGMPMGKAPGGMSGSTGASIKYLEARFAGDEDEAESTDLLSGSSGTTQYTQDILLKYDKDDDGTLSQIEKAKMMEDMAKEKAQMMMVDATRASARDNMLSRFSALLQSQMQPSFSTTA